MRRIQLKTTKVAENQVQGASRKSKRVLLPAILACLMAAGSAFAGTAQVDRGGGQTFTGICCFSWVESVSIAEGATIKPVVVTWSADYAVNVADAYFAGISVNGGECQTAVYGARVLWDNPGPGSAYSSATFQWIILPTDGVLIKGNNKFELCGGGKNSNSDSITIGQNTLMVQLSK